MKRASSHVPQMVVKIPIIRGKMISEKKVLESPATKPTRSEEGNLCRFEVAEASKPRRSHHAFSSNANEDNSSISSRSSMNSGSGFDRDCRDGRSEDKSTIHAAATNTTTASTSIRVMAPENHSIAIASPSDQSREQTDHHDSSPDTLIIGVSTFVLEIVLHTFTSSCSYSFASLWHGRNLSRISIQTQQDLLVSPYLQRPRPLHRQPQV